MSEEIREPGHLGNDTSGMSLLENLDDLTHEDREPNPEVHQALKDLNKLNIREAIDEADG